MKKQHIFLIELSIILYLFYLIIDFSYKEYRINSSIDYITQLNQQTREAIIVTTDLIDYKSSSAHKNKILKEQQSLKNKWESVLYLTTEETFNTYNTIRTGAVNIPAVIPSVLSQELKHLSIYEKWMYFLQRK